MGGDLGKRMLMGGLSGTLSTGTAEGFYRGAGAGIIPADGFMSDLYDNNAFANSIITLGREYTRGYIITGDKQGAEFYAKGAIVNNAIGHGAAYYQARNKPTFKDGVWQYVGDGVGIPFSIGNVIGLPPLDKNANDGFYHFKYKEMVKHEINHSKFQDVLGPWYLPLHGINRVDGEGYFLGIECPGFMPPDKQYTKCETQNQN